MPGSNPDATDTAAGPVEAGPAMKAEARLQGLSVPAAAGTVAQRRLLAADNASQQGQQQAAAFAAATKQPEQTASSFGKALRSLSSRFYPTNYNMLLFRTLNRELCLPNANDDYIAPLFRDRLMPLRSWVQRSLPGMTAMTRRGVEDPAVGVPGVCNFVDARTKWLDGAVKQALDGGISQVVCIAAGFDTRAYRFARPGVKFFEVDLPSASLKKQALVAAVLPGPQILPRPIYIAADLARQTLAEALNGSGFDVAKPTLFACEGLIYYLPAEAVTALLASVATIAAPSSRLLFDFLHANAQDGSTFYPGYSACAESVARKGEAFISGLIPQEEEMAAYLAPMGWRLSRLLVPRQMLGAQLPHEAWSDELPPILAFYSYAEVEKPTTHVADQAGLPTGSKAALPVQLEREHSLIQALAAAELG